MTPVKRPVKVAARVAAAALVLSMGLSACKTQVGTGLIQLSAPPAPAGGATQTYAEPAEPVAGLPAEADTRVVLSGTEGTVEGRGATVQDGTLTITRAGIYDISGTFSGGIVVAVQGPALEDDRVTLVLNGLRLESPDDPAIDVEGTLRKTVVYTQKDSVNVLVSGWGDLHDDDPDDDPEDMFDAPDAAIWSEDVLEVGGEGVLYIRSEDGNAIYGGADTRITGGVVALKSRGDAVGCRGSLTVAGGDAGVLYVESGGIGLYAEGDCTAESGTVHIVSGGSGIFAEGSLAIKGGDCFLLCGGGVQSSASLSADGLLPLPGTGLCARKNLTLSGGSLSADCAGDGLHAGADLTLSGGNACVTCNNTALWAADALSVADGVTGVQVCALGARAGRMNITGGTLYLTAQTQGILLNSEGTGAGDDPPPLQEELEQSGGSLFVNAGQTGLEAAGGCGFTGGTALFQCAGPALKTAYARVQGGSLLALGAQGATPLTSRGQAVLTVETDAPAGTMLALSREKTVRLAAYALWGAQTLSVSAPGLEEGAYTLTTGCVLADGTVQWGLCAGGTISGGTRTGPFTAAPAL